MNDASLTAPTMVLHLWHGRRTVDEDMNDWGFEGPTIGPLVGLQSTYYHTWRVDFVTSESQKLWQPRLGWHVWDDGVLEMPEVSEMIRIQHNGLEAFFGDWRFEMCPATETALTLACKADLWWLQYAEQCKVDVVP